MLQIVLGTPALVLPPVPPAVQIVQQRAPLAEPSIPTPFLLAKEGVPKVQYDYTRGLDELNGIDIWADIPTSSEVNRAKGTDKVYQKTVKTVRAHIHAAQICACLFFFGLLLQPSQSSVFAALVTILLACFAAHGAGRQRSRGATTWLQDHRRGD